MAENDSSSVVVLLDVSAAGWTSAVASETGGKLTLKACVEAVVVFVNAVQLLDRRNHVALVRALPHHPVPSPFSMIRLSGASFTISCGCVADVLSASSCEPADCVHPVVRGIAVASSCWRLPSLRTQRSTRLWSFV